MVVLLLTLISTVFYSNLSLWTILALAIGAFVLIRTALEYIRLPNLERKAIFVTGCDTGFGREAALRLAKFGCRVYAGCLTEKGISSIENEAKGSNLNLVGVSLDITNDESVQNAVKFVQNDMPTGIKLWALLNNAGVFNTYGPAEWCNIDEYKVAMELNFYGAVRCTHAFLPLIKQSKGRIGFTTSVAGRFATPCATPYSSAKYALAGYVEAASTEVYDFGVRYAIFEPGVFKTALLDELAKQTRVDFAWNKMSESLREEYGEEYKQSFLSSWTKGMNFVGSSRTHRVPDAYIHFATSRFPRFRYRCGWDSKLLWCPLSLLPTELSRFIWIQKPHFVPAAVKQKKYD